MKTLATLLVACAAASAAQAQSFSYTDFNSATGLTVLHALGPEPPTFITPPGVVGTSMRLTTSTPLSQRTVMWHDTPVAVANGFDTTFDYTISSLTSGGGDGIALVIQNDPRGTMAMGRHAAAMGYGLFLNSGPGEAVANAIAIELDMFMGNPWNDPDHNHISVHTNSTGDCSQHEDTSIGRHSDFTLGSGSHTVRVEYVPGTLKVYFDDLINPVIDVPYDFATGGTWIDSSTAVGGLNLIGGTSMLVGLTASTGGSTQNQDIDSWSWTSSAGGPVSYCTSGTTQSGCRATMGSAGTPSLSNAGPFSLTTSSVEGSKNGILFYGITGRNASTWGIGGSSFLCVKSPTQRTPLQSSGGTGGLCDGSFFLDWNAYVAANPGKAINMALTVGMPTQGQAWFRDPGSVKNTSLSDGLEWTVGP